MRTPTLSFDRRIPFVDTVWRVIEGKASLDEAVDVLTRAEQAHGLRVLGEPYDLFVDDMYMLRPGVPPPTFAELESILRNMEEFDRCFRMDDSRDAEWSERVLFPFLDDTHLVLTGGDFCNWYCLVTRELLVGHTWRWWGHTLADWANSRAWLQPAGAAPGVHWEYTDFYMQEYLEPVIEGYDSWRQTVQRVLDEKTSRWAG